MDGQALAVMGVATASSFVLPFVAYGVLRWRMGPEDAAAIAATFGSISAVTFVTAVAFLDHAGVSYSGYLVASMALMESPAIVSGVLLARLAAGRARRRERAASGQASGASADEGRTDWGELLREAGLNGAVVLLVGAMVIGYVTGERGWATVSAFVYDPFKGVLCLFLLDMGLLAARRVDDLKRAGVFLVGFGVVWAVVQGLMGVGAAVVLGLDRGDALLLAILFGSASYIAVPAALRLALPGANPSLYIPLALGITFPFNIVVGIPMYYALLGWLGLEASVGG
ncbi:MAG: sodium-dependent bicarbonate transport family permease [Planctomycetota bacterium]